MVSKLMRRVALICGLSARYLFRSSLSETRDAWKVIATVIGAGIVNSFGIGLVTTTLYQMIVVGKDGTFEVLAAANFSTRLTTKPLTIVASALVVFLVNRAAYRPVVKQILGRAV